MSNEYKNTRKSDWFKRFMIFLLVIVVALSLGLMIFYFAQDGEKIAIKKADTQVNATESFSVELVQTKYNKSTKITPSYDETAFSLQEDLTKIVTKGKNRTITFVFEAKENVEGTYEVGFKTNSKNKNSKQMSVQVCVANGVEVPYFVAEAKNLATIGKSTMFSVNKNYQLTNNIDLSDYPNWTPIANFSGTFDGNGKTISNLKIDVTDDDQTAFGLFGRIQSGGVVKNLKMLDAKISGTPTKDMNIGIVAGECYGKVERVLIDSTSGDSSYIKIGSVAEGLEATTKTVNIGSSVGLLARQNAQSIPMVDRVGVLDDVKVMVATSSSNNSYVGGLVGLSESGTIINSYARGSVLASGSKVCLGGIAGKLGINLISGDETVAVTTAMKGNIVNTYTTSKVGNIEGQGGVQSMFAVVGANENLGTMTQKSPTRTYTSNIALTNNVQKQTFSGDSVETSRLHENRYVGVYYLYNGLNWAPNGVYNGQSWTSDTYKLVVGSSKTSDFEFKTYNFAGTLKDWDFNNIWTWDGSKDGFPRLMMKDYTYSLNVYDPQSAYTGEIVQPTDVPPGNQGGTDTPKVPIDEIKDKDTQNEIGIYNLASDITISSDWEPFELKSTIHGNGHTITITNANFKGLFTKIARDARVENVTIIANFNNVGKDISISSDGFGILAYENNGSISGVTIKNSALTMSGSKTSSRAIGAMVGVNNGTIENSKIENSTITLNGFNRETYVGAFAGKNSSGQIISCEVSGGTISGAESTGVIYAGLVAGMSESSSLIQNTKVLGNITLKTDAENYAAGIVARMINSAKVNTVLVNSGNIEANMAAGICANMYVTEAGTTKSAEAVNIAQVNSGVTLKGKIVGGLFGIMDRGIARNCAVYATLKTADSGSVVCGFAYQINGSGKVEDHQMAELYTSFASSTFNTSQGGTAYNETTSDVRNQNGEGFFGWFVGGWNDVMGSAPDNPTDGKTAGYIRDCYFNGTVMQGKDALPSGNNNRVISKLSEADCKNKDKFSGWNLSIWTFNTNSMPVLKDASSL